MNGSKGAFKLRLFGQKKELLSLHNLKTNKQGSRKTKKLYVLPRVTTEAAIQQMYLVTVKKVRTDTL
jgi:hypothetical protein